MSWRLLDKRKGLENEPDYVARGLIHDINEQVIAQMRALGLRNKDLAVRLGVSSAYITKLLEGNPNLTVRSLARVALALDSQPSIEFRPRGVVRPWRRATPEVEERFEVTSDGARTSKTQDAST